MDEATINKKGLQPLQPELDRINAMKNLRDLAAEIARLHRIGVDVMFNFSSGQDFKDSTAVIGQADQGGIGLPEKDYYFRTDAKAVETRKEYVAHITRMLQLLGASAADAAKQANAIMSLETALAKASLDVTARRDPRHGLPQDETGGVRSAGRFLRLELFTSRRMQHAQNGQPQCGRAGVFQGQGTAAEERVSGGLENVSHLPSRRWPGSRPADEIRR